ncbi:MAG: hypothetical protein M3331_02590, partial [Actinomycetota bacterium]|nr:hypothetical protein [Actinomycetota bacterium]
MTSRRFQPICQCARGRTVALFAGLAVAACLAPAAAPAASASPPKVVPAKQNPAEVRAYWTPGRMLEAVPVAGPAAGLAAEVRPENGAEPGKPLAIEPTAADSSIDDPERLDSAEQVPDNTSYPTRTHGKVFFTIPNQGDFVCSGTVVRSRSKQLAWTAGHCVYDDISGRFATNWTFVPGYQDGERPFGEWPARQLATTGPWKRSGNLSYDVGAAKLAKRNGKPIQKVVGARGIAFNQPREQGFRAFGYPAEPNPLTLQLFTGQRLYACDSPRTDDDDPPGSGPDTLEINCDMTGGSSGGGWVIDGRFVNSVVSYGY